MMNSSKRRVVATLVLALGFTGLISWAQEAAEPAAAAPPPVAKKMTLWNLIVVGGWAMWPLGACSFAMIALAVVNYQKINGRKVMPQDILAQLKAAAREQDVQKIFDVASAHDSLFTNALAAGLRHVNVENPAESKAAVEEAIGEAVTRQESQLGYWINFLSLVTAMSPMWGLLGTVSGMIGAFQKIGAGGMGKPELLASNIGEALITTAAGLLIAIPSMFFYFIHRNRLSHLIQQAEDQFTVILDDLTGTGLAREPAPEEAKV